MGPNLGLNCLQRLSVDDTEGVCCIYLLILLTKYRSKQCGPRSDFGLHCLTKRLLKHFSRQGKQITFAVIGVVRVKSAIMAI